MQALCQWDVQQDQSSTELRLFLSGDYEESVADSAVQDYASTLVQEYWAKHDQIDKMIAAVSREWSLARMASADRNVIRVAIVELLAGQVPPNATINEAIEIARAYGGAESPAFVNGILDSLRQQLSGGDGTE